MELCINRLNYKLNYYLIYVNLSYGSLLIYFLKSKKNDGPNGLFCLDIVESTLCDAESRFEWENNNSNMGEILDSGLLISGVRWQMCMDRDIWNNVKMRENILYCGSSMVVCVLGMSNNVRYTRYILLYLVAVHVVYLLAFFICLTVVLYMETEISLMVSLYYCIYKLILN